MQGAAAKIGPNAIVQLAASFAAGESSGQALAIFTKAGCAHRLTSPPTAMVEEAEVSRLFKAVAESMAQEHAVKRLADAGARTGDYVYEHRIPSTAKRILPLLPARLGLRSLLAAVKRNAWTFAGSGTFTVSHNSPCEVRITGNKAATHVGCAWHRAVFERLFERTLQRHVVVTEIECEGRGGRACTFTIELRRRASSGVHRQ